MVAAGQYDVGMTLEDPHWKVLYEDVKKQYDSFNWKSEVGQVKLAQLSVEHEQLCKQV